MGTSDEKRDVSPCRSYIKLLDLKSVLEIECKSKGRLVYQKTNDSNGNMLTFLFISPFSNLIPTEEVS